MQNNLFDTSSRQPLSLGQGAIVEYYPAWLGGERAHTIMNTLSTHCPWSQPSIVISGRRMPIPRLQCWYGDAAAVLHYSGRSFQPLPWLECLSLLREELQTLCNTPFNSVLANLYRDGSDSVSWHADDERELGASPVIASLSLGATRKFSMKPKTKESHSKAQHLELGHGDLLVMRGETQANWLHCLAKTKKPVGKRINLTFRNVCHPRGSNSI